MSEECLGPEQQTFTFQSRLITYITFLPFRNHQAHILPVSSINSRLELLTSYNVLLFLYGVRINDGVPAFHKILSAIKITFMTHREVGTGQLYIEAQDGCMVQGCRLADWRGGGQFNGGQVGGHMLYISLSDRRHLYRYCSTYTRLACLPCVHRHRGIDVVSGASTYY